MTGTPGELAYDQASGKVYSESHSTAPLKLPVRRDAINSSSRCHMQTVLRGFLRTFVLAASLGAFLCPGEGTSQSLTTLYSFTSQVDTGPSSPVPGGSLILDSNGALYGTTAYGGDDPSGCGTVFELGPPTTQGGPWTISTLYSFTGANGDGCRPEAGVIFGPNGELFGTTTVGGTVQSGTVYQLAPPAQPGGAWTETILYSFRGGSDGTLPYGALAADHNGILYGTTYWGGLKGQGVRGGCGSTGCGTVFALKPPTQPGGSWTETVLYRFLGLAGDGAEPLAGLVIGRGGERYGTTAGGGQHVPYPPYTLGTVFELRPSAGGRIWKETILHAFTGQTTGDGADPFANLTMGADGALYGTTYYGGTGSFCLSGCGIAFQLTPPANGGAWTETVLYSFLGQNGDGNNPEGGLIESSNGFFYGSTRYGGGAASCESAGCGTLFELVPPAGPGGSWTESVLHIFTGQLGAGDGAGPQAALVFGQGGVLFGTTGGGGVYGWGTAFELIP